MANFKTTYGTAEGVKYVSAGLVNNGKKFSTLINFSTKSKINLNEQDFSL